VRRRIRDSSSSDSDYSAESDDEQSVVVEVADDDHSDSDEDSNTEHDSWDTSESSHLDGLNIVPPRIVSDFFKTSWRADRVTSIKLLWGSLIAHPVSSLELTAAWPFFPLGTFQDDALVSDLKPSEAPFWSLTEFSHTGVCREYLNQLISESTRD
jgi:hypothetical protein